MLLGDLARNGHIAVRRLSVANGYTQASVRLLQPDDRLHARIRRSTQHTPYGIRQPNGEHALQTIQGQSQTLGKLQTIGRGDRLPVMQGHVVFSIRQSIEHAVLADKRFVRMGECGDLRPGRRPKADIGSIKTNRRLIIDCQPFEIVLRYDKAPGELLAIDRHMVGSHAHRGHGDCLNDMGSRKRRADIRSRCFVRSVPHGRIQPTVFLPQTNRFGVSCRLVTVIARKFQLRISVAVVRQRTQRQQKATSQIGRPGSGSRSLPLEEHIIQDGILAQSKAGCGADKGLRCHDPADPLNRKFAVRPKADKGTVEHIDGLIAIVQLPETIGGNQRRIALYRNLIYVCTVAAPLHIVAEGQYMRLIHGQSGLRQLAAADLHGKTSPLIGEAQQAVGSAAAVRLHIHPPIAARKPHRHRITAGLRPGGQIEGEALGQFHGKGGFCRPGRRHGEIVRSLGLRSFRTLSHKRRIGRHRISIGIQTDRPDAALRKDRQIAAAVHTRFRIVVIEVVEFRLCIRNTAPQTVDVQHIIHRIGNDLLSEGQIQQSGGRIPLPVIEPHIAATSRHTHLVAALIRIKQHIGRNIGIIQQPRHPERIRIPIPLFHERDMQAPERIRILPLKAPGQIDGIAGGGLYIGLLKHDVMPSGIPGGHRSVHRIGKGKGMGGILDLFGGYGSKAHAERCALIRQADVGTPECAGSRIVIVQSIKGCFGIADMPLLAVHIETVINSPLHHHRLKHHGNLSGGRSTDRVIQAAERIPGGHTDTGIPRIEQQIGSHIRLVTQPIHHKRHSRTVLRLLKAQMQAKLGILKIPPEASGQIDRIVGGNADIAHVKRNAVGTVRMIGHRPLPLGKAGKGFGFCRIPIAAYANGTGSPLRKNRQIAALIGAGSFIVVVDRLEFRFGKRNTGPHIVDVQDIVHCLGDGLFPETHIQQRCGGIPLPVIETHIAATGGYAHLVSPLVGIEQQIGRHVGVI